MTRPTAIVLLVSLLIPCAVHSAAPLAKQPLSLLQDEQLANLRATGVLTVASPMSAEERESLREAERSAAELLDKRGGEISNSTLVTILLVLAIVALVLIIV